MSRLDILKQKNLSLKEDTLDIIHCRFKGLDCPEPLITWACAHCFAHKSNLTDLINKLDEVIHEPN